MENITRNISKMLTLSLSHLTQETREELAEDNTKNHFSCLSVYEKTAGECYGYFVYIDEVLFAEQCLDGSLPYDLRCVIQFSLDNNCDILCLDTDGPEVYYLPRYEYSENGDCSFMTCICAGNTMYSHKLVSYELKDLLQYQMPERITKRMIRTGRAKGIIELIHNPIDGDISAKIGEHWFYFAGEAGEGDITIAEFKAKHTETQIVDMIYRAVNDTPINNVWETDATEALYYMYYLNENI